MYGVNCATNRACRCLKIVVRNERLEEDEITEPQHVVRRAPGAQEKRCSASSLPRSDPDTLPSMNFLFVRVHRACNFEGFETEDLLEEALNFLEHFQAPQ